jgi:hypothetical protein
MLTVVSQIHVAQLLLNSWDKYARNVPYEMNGKPFCMSHVL